VAPLLYVVVDGEGGVVVVKKTSISGEGTPRRICFVAVDKTCSQYGAHLYPTSQERWPSLRAVIHSFPRGKSPRGKNI